MKYIKSSGKYKFIKDIEDFKKICGTFLILKGERITDVHIDEDHYVAHIENYAYHTVDLDRRPALCFDGSTMYTLKNDFDVYADGDIMTPEYATKLFRTYQTKSFGKEYVDALEEYLTNQVKTEVKKYRNLLEDEAE